MTRIDPPGPDQEQTRARYPDVDGYVERDGVRIFYEVYGAGDPTIMLLPTWELVHSRAWKLQIPFLARHGRVVTFDRRGNGRSDRPAEVHAYDRRETAADAIAVLDAAQVESALVVSWCGAGDDLIMAVDHPERVAGLVLIAPDLLLADDPADLEGLYRFDEAVAATEGWAGRWNRLSWLRDWRGFLEFFFAETFTEAHSSKQIEDAVGWGLQTDAETVLRGLDASWPNAREEALVLLEQIRCPTLVVQGSDDAVVGAARGAAVADAIPGARLFTVEGGGHAPQLRDPVATNLLIREFAHPQVRSR